MKPQILIIGLGPGSWTSIPIGSYEILQSANMVFLGTKDHPVIKEFESKGIRYSTFDEKYEHAPDDESVSENIASELIEKAKTHGQVVYAVPGHPGFGETTVRLIIEKASSTDVEVQLGPGHSFLDELVSRMGVDPTDGVAFVDGTRLLTHQVTPFLHTFITQVHNQDIASDVKLTLMEHYPDEYEVVVARAIGVKDEEHLESIPLYELDRLDWLDLLTTVYVPATDMEEVTNRQFWKLIDIVRSLRSPGGCPWDREQTHQSLRKHVIEEAHEVADAIDRDEPMDLSEELGDLLLQVALHTQIAAEEGMFDIHDAIQAINEKLIRRHPHVFGSKEVESSDQVVVNWEAIKRDEKRAKGIGAEDESILDAVKSGMPAMVMAYELQKKAAKVGFEWPDISGVYEKLQEEIRELEETDDKGDELGDVLFVLINLARYLKIDPEESLARTNRKFRRRFQYIERMVKRSGSSLENMGLEQLDAWWNEAKTFEKK